MKITARAVFAGMSALAIAACSQAEEEPAAEEIVAEETQAAETAEETAAAAPEEVFEVCDENGNRYPSEADAQAAGLSEAEYGATFCDYFPEE